MFEKMKQDIAFWIYPQAELQIKTIEQERLLCMVEIEKLKHELAMLLHERKNLGDERDVLRKRCEELEIRHNYRPDPKNLMRELMGGIKLDMTAQQNYLVPLSVEEIRDMNRWGYELHSSRWWKYLTSALINIHAAQTLGVILHDRDRSLFGSGRLDGLMLLRDEVESRKAAHESDTQKPEQFDEHNIIQDN